MSRPLRTAGPTTRAHVTRAALLATVVCSPALDAQARPTPRPAAPPITSSRDSIRGIARRNLLIDGRTWLGVYGTMSLGAAVERVLTAPGRLGPGTLGVGGSVDLYRYTQGFAGVGDWSVTVIPIGGFANYHLHVASLPRLDPYVGLGLGFAHVRATARALGESVSESGRASGPFSSGQIGARWFFTPNLAAQVQTGWGIGDLAIGVSWKR